MGAKHQDPTYKRMAKQVRDAAYADPDTKCQRCGKRLDQHPPHKSGRAPTWHAGHIDPDDLGAGLGPEASTCNIVAGNLERQHNTGDATTTNWYNPTKKPGGVGNTFL